MARTIRAGHHHTVTCPWNELPRLATELATAVPPAPVRPDRCRRHLDQGAAVPVAFPPRARPSLPASTETGRRAPRVGSGITTRRSQRVTAVAHGRSGPAGGLPDDRRGPGEGAHRSGD